VTGARALLIDLDGVLRRWDTPAAGGAEGTFGLPPGVVAATAFAAPLLRRAITGQISDDAWRQEVVARLAGEYGRERAAGAVAAWSAPAGRVDETVLALVRAVRRRAPVVLVTNATTRLDADLARLGLGGAFDAVASSSRIGAGKPEAEIFRAALAAAGVHPGAALFVDDSDGNVAAAQALGLKGYRFEDAARLEVVLRASGLLGDGTGDGQGW
jgi:putative hydrolase of the HAD superfamily